MAPVTVVQARPEMGFLWAKVCGPGQGAPGVFVALCYMPCETSEYYRQSGLSKETHWEGLRRDAAEFGDEGSVLIMDDLNGRRGTESDIGDLGDEWEEDQVGELTAASAARAARMRAALLHLPLRRSLDAARPTVAGRALLTCAG